MSFGQEFVTLFKNMPIASIICLIIGIVLIIIEIFQPGFGIFGILGGALSIVGIVLRVLVGDGNVFAQIFILLFFDVIIILIAFFAMLLTAKKGWLNRSPLIQNDTAVDKDHSEGTADYSALVGMLGIAVTDLRPVGRANIDCEAYDVVADGFFIKKGEGIKVVSVEGSKITVTRAE